MASCVKCGKPIGLIEYTFGESKQVGLCKRCRKIQKWCDDCAYMLTISVEGENGSVNRCIKYGYDLSKRRSWKIAANCQDYTSKNASKDSTKTGNGNKLVAHAGLNRHTTPKREELKADGWG